MTITELDFDGKTYEQERDGKRLNTLLNRVLEVMSDGKWHPLPWICEQVGKQEASVTARLRDLRKEKFGGYTVEASYIAKGLYQYRVLV